MSLDAMKQALEALYNMVEDGDETDKRQAIAAITALRFAIEQAERQEPVAWANINKHGDITHTSNKRMPWANTPLYTAPPQRQPLTEEEIIEHFKARVDTGSLLSFADGVRFAERKHGIGGEE